MLGLSIAHVNTGNPLECECDRDLHWRVPVYHDQRTSGSARGKMTEITHREDPLRLGGGTGIATSLAATDDIRLLIW